MIKPLTNRILVRPINKPPGRIILPPSHQPNEDDPIEAEVVLLGTARQDKRGRPIPWTTKPGDRVLVVDYMGAPVQAFGQRHLVVREDAILALIQG